MKLRHLFFVLLGFGLSSTAQSASAPSILYRYAYHENVVSGQAPQTPLFEVLAGELESQSEFAEYSAWIHTELGTVDEIRVLDAPLSRRAPSSQSSRQSLEDALSEARSFSPHAQVVHERLDDESSKRLQKTYPTWFKKSYRVTFTAIRFFQSGGVAFTSLWLSGSVPLKIAIPSSIVAGLISSLAQWNIVPLGKWLVSGDLTRTFFKSAAPRMAQFAKKRNPTCVGARLS